MPKSKSKLRPIHDRIIVRPDSADDQSPGGIIIPENAKQKPRYGTVHAAGDGYRFANGTERALQVKKGDRVMVESWAGNPVTLDGVEHLVMNESNIVAVIES